MKTEICVPSGALNVDAEGQSVGPSVGDDVEFSGKGVVSRVEGGNTYLNISEVNGQPVMGDTEKESPMDGEEAEMDAMVGEEEKRRQGSGQLYSALLLLLLAVFWLLASSSAMAAEDVRWAGARVCSGNAVSNYVAVAAPAQVYSVEINNFTGGTLYLLVFDSSTNQLNGASPHVSAVPVATGTIGYHDWGASGLPCRFGVNVCLSTTPFSLTNASGGGTATVVYNGK